MLNAFNSTTYAEQFPAFNPARNRWEMLDATCENMRCLFDTEAAALEFKRIELRRLVDREEWQKQNTEAQHKANEERAAYLASFRGFLPDDPMRAGRVLQTLEKKFRFRDEARTRKQIIETLVSEGRFLSNDGLESKEGTFMRIGKTERDYAAHLIALRESAPTGV